MSRKKRPKPKLKEIVPKLSHIYAYFWPQIKPYRWRLMSALGALAVSVFIRLLEPWPLKIFLDNVIGDAANAQGVFANWQPRELLMAVAVAMVIIAVIRSLSEYFSRVGFFVVGNRVVMKVRDRLYRHMQRLSLGFHSRARSGDLIIRVTRDVSLVRDVTATAIMPLMASFSMLLGMVAVMFFLSWQLTLLALVTLPLFWLTTFRLGKQIRESAKKQRMRESAMASTASESLIAIRMIKAMGLEDRFADSFGTKNAQSQKEDLRASRLSVRLGRTIDVLLAISSAIVIWFGGKLALAGDMSAGDIVVFLTYLKRSFKPAQEFAKYVARLSKAAAAGERVIEILETRPEIRDKADAVELDRCTGSIRFDEVSFSYKSPESAASKGDGEPAKVLDHVSLEIKPGQFVSLVGPSGGGKSTIIALILRLFEPEHGSVTVDETDIREFTIQSLRAQTSSVMQEPLLLADTVYGNIACAAEDATESEVLEAARLANAHEFIQQIPGGYDAKIGERGATLSRGQQQRIALARAAIRRTPILLLDEPTTGLDEESESKVVDALRRLSSGRTTIMATHNLTMASQADRIFFVEAGRIVEQGSHPELIAKKGRYATWYARQQSRSQRPGGTQKFSVVS